MTKEGKEKREKNSHLTEEFDCVHRRSVGTVCLELEPIDIHNEEEDAASLHVFEEPVAHADVVAGSLYQAWQVRQSHPPEVREVAGSEVWLNGSEGVAGDLGTGSGDCLQQGALARVREAYKPDVCDELEVQLDTLLLASDAAVVCLPGPPRTAPGHQQSVVVSQQVSHHLSSVRYHGHSHRGLYYHVTPILAHAFQFPGRN